ncbi:hypothetical protein ACROYT_G021110 [Oculina patagonica]
MTLLRNSTSLANGIGMVMKKADKEDNYTCFARNEAGTDSKEFPVTFVECCTCAVKCGTVWCGVVQFGVVWLGVVWCASVWCDVMWYGFLCCGMVRCVAVRCVMSCGAVRYGERRACGMVCYGCCGLVCCGTLWRSVVW